LGGKYEKGEEKKRENMTWKRRKNQSNGGIEVTGVKYVQKGKSKAKKGAREVNSFGRNISNLMATYY
jgi:hypothetical protein